MRELLTIVENWFSENKQIALATVVKVYGSAPRGLGAKMVVNNDGLMAGSVSGGCVEGAVITESLEVIKRQQPRLVKYGISDDQAFEIGLACGGNIEVFIEPLMHDDFLRIKQAIIDHKMFAKITVINGEDCGDHFYQFGDGNQFGKLKSAWLQGALEEVLVTRFQDQQNHRLLLDHEEQKTEVFLDIFPPPPRLIIIGAVHIAIPLVEFAKPLGFRTIVVDPRKAFSNRERFPFVDELAQRWPQDYLPEIGLDEGCYLVALSHDDKLDVPALAEALNTRTHYIGALGSKSTFENHKRDLRELGILEADIQRIHSPIGLNIGASGPEEIALSIMAEIIAVRNGLR
jgi:xanthine dehydrogenase accessory factor